MSKAEVVCGKIKGLMCFETFRRHVYDVSPHLLHVCDMFVIRCPNHAITVVLKSNVCDRINKTVLILK